MSRIEKLISIMPQEFEAAIVTSFVNRFYPNYKRRLNIRLNFQDFLNCLLPLKA